ncbi:unnamed protein product [Rhizoctonia solani]|uniref:Uncharacterized protein n=1 Tax=Rhizoctonia solani TaxID=456999 RepID=A0A8H3E350_9AGAM|nr:unnamed protein product [Rhizoctonia solani]
MSIQFLRDGIRRFRNPSGDTLFSWPDRGLDYLYLHNVTLKVVDAPPDARLIITRVQVNESTMSGHGVPADYWIVPSNADGLKYTGFTQQPSVAQVESSTTYVSSTAGDTMSIGFNGQTCSLVKSSHTNGGVSSFNPPCVRTMWS